MPNALQADFRALQQQLFVVTWIRLLLCMPQLARWKMGAGMGAADRVSLSHVSFLCECELCADKEAL